MADDTQTEPRRLLTYCGLDFESACLQFHENRRAVRTAVNMHVAHSDWRIPYKMWPTAISVGHRIAQIPRRRCRVLERAELSLHIARSLKLVLGVTCLVIIVGMAVVLGRRRNTLVLQAPTEPAS
jgi:hypothetical protein